MVSQHHMMKKKLILIFLSLLLVACGSAKKLNYNLDQTNCSIPVSLKQNITSNPVPFYKLDLDTSLTNYFSTKSLYIANTIGIFNLLNEYAEKIKTYKSMRSIEKRLELLELSQNISSKISLASLEVSSFASELDCEEEKIAQIADYLSGKEQGTESTLTSVAIGIGAISSVSLGALAIAEKSNKNTELIGIGTGISEALLGVWMLVQNKKATVVHHRNILRSLWTGSDTAAIFPSFIWEYLNYYNPNSTIDNTSKRTSIINQWEAFNQINVAKPDKAAVLIELYFGNGGKYTSSQLYNRANMYDQLESYIKLMKQDLTLLTIELENLKVK